MMIICLKDYIPPTSATRLSIGRSCVPCQRADASGSPCFCQLRRAGVSSAADIGDGSLQPSQCLHTVRKTTGEAAKTRIVF